MPGVMSSPPRINDLYGRTVVGRIVAAAAVIEDIYLVAVCRDGWKLAVGGWNCKSLDTLCK